MNSIDEQELEIALSHVSDPEHHRVLSAICGWVIQFKNEGMSDKLIYQFVSNYPGVTVEMLASWAYATDRLYEALAGGEPVTTLQ